jgi:hypothetical protein
MNGEGTHGTHGADDAHATGGETLPPTGKDQTVDECVRAFLARLGSGEIPAPTEEQMASLRKLAAGGNGAEARAPKGGE